MAKKAKAVKAPRPMTGVAEALYNGIGTRVIWASMQIVGGGRFVIGDARYYRVVPKRKERRRG